MTMDDETMAAGRPAPPATASAARAAPVPQATHAVRIEGLDAYYGSTTRSGASIWSSIRDG